MNEHRNRRNLLLLLLSLVIISGFLYQELTKSGLFSGLSPKQPASATVTSTEAPETAAEPSVEVNIDPALASVAWPLQFTACDPSYFDDALFIGDSRTLGLSQYGTLQNADYFADSGMNLYKLNDVTVSIEEQDLTLSQLLEAKDYGKIYLMLGINELGYDFDTSVKKYRELTELLKASEPDAVIYLCANLHVTKNRSEGEPIYNNANIDRFNRETSKLADWQQLFYLDVNELFDDPEGNLDPAYTADDAHVLGKYYALWCDWLCTKAILK